MAVPQTDLLQAIRQAGELYHRLVFACRYPGLRQDGGDPSLSHYRSITRSST